MKKLMILSIATMSLISSLSFAETLNPGEDPNLAKGNKASEADVAAPGICPECIANLYHGRLGDVTLPGSGSSTGQSKDDSKSSSSGSR